MIKGLKLEEVFDKFIKGTIIFEDLQKRGWCDFDLDQIELNKNTFDGMMDICREYWGKTFNTRKSELWGITDIKYKRMSFDNAWNRFLEDHYVRLILYKKFVFFFIYLNHLNRISACRDLQNCISFGEDSHQSMPKKARMPGYCCAAISLAMDSLY